MTNIRFEFDGNAVTADEMVNGPHRAMFESIATRLDELLADIHDPISRECPSVVLRGSSLDSLAIDIEWTDAVVAEVCERLQTDFDETTDKR